MELKIFRDTMPQAGTVCTVKAELPLETEILVSDYLPPVFKLVKCFAKPVTWSHNNRHLRSMSWFLSIHPHSGSTDPVPVFLHSRQ